MIGAAVDTDPRTQGAQRGPPRRAPAARRKARFRHRSIASVREHLRVIAEIGGSGHVRFVTPTCIAYGSENTSVNLEAVEALLAAVREELGKSRKIYFGTFPSEIRPEHVTPDAMRILARYVDNRSLIIGGQSGSDRVLEATWRSPCSTAFAPTWCSHSQPQLPPAAWHTAARPGAGSPRARADRRHAQHGRQRAPCTGSGRRSS